jgi:hypothetical protein
MYYLRDVEVGGRGKLNMVIIEIRCECGEWI